MATVMAKWLAGVAGVVLALGGAAMAGPQDEGRRSAGASPNKEDFSLHRSTRVLRQRDATDAMIVKALTEEIRSRLRVARQSASPAIRTGWGEPYRQGFDVAMLVRKMVETEPEGLDARLGACPRNPAGPARFRVSLAVRARHCAHASRLPRSTGSRTVQRRLRLWSATSNSPGHIRSPRGSSDRLLAAVGAQIEELDADERRGELGKLLRAGVALHSRAQSRTPSILVELVQAEGTPGHVLMIPLDIFRNGRLRCPPELLGDVWRLLDHPWLDDYGTHGMKFFRVRGAALDSLRALGVEYSWKKDGEPTAEDSGTREVVVRDGRVACVRVSTLHAAINALLAAESQETFECGLRAAKQVGRREAEGVVRRALDKGVAEHRARLLNELLDAWKDKR